MLKPLWKQPPLLVPGTNSNELTWKLQMINDKFKEAHTSKLQMINDKFKGAHTSKLSTMSRWLLFLHCPIFPFAQEEEKNQQNKTFKLISHITTKKLNSQYETWFPKMWPGRKRRLGSWRSSGKQSGTSPWNSCT